MPPPQPRTDTEAAAPKPGKTHSFMLRTKLPGGHLTPEQYLVHDDIADRYGNGTLRITTRQCFQFHGVLKGDLKASLQELNNTLVTSLGACGDVVRNVCCCPAPIDDPIRRQIEATTRQISDHLLPRTRAYHEIWLDDEKVYDGEKLQEDEPLYGKTYLPRKFKIAIAYPGDNCVDVYTQDVGLIAIVDGPVLLGYNVVAGGGMGMNHTKADTFPRLGDPLAFVTPDQVLEVVENDRQGAARLRQPQRPQVRPHEVSHPQLGHRPLPRRVGEPPGLSAAALCAHAPAAQRTPRRLAGTGRRSLVPRASRSRTAAWPTRKSAASRAGSARSSQGSAWASASPRTRIFS